MVYLTIKNIIIKKLNKKLDYKYLKLYKIIKRISENNYQLNAINVKLINTKRNDVKVKKEKYKAKKVFNIRNY